MHKVSSYLAIIESVVLKEKCKNLLELVNVCTHSLPSGEVSKEWTQEKNILSFIEISRRRNVSRIRIFWAACLNLVNSIGKIHENII